uniref:Uncharacterized protein n=1 Tax=Solanum tuberosum TaxID=4113 RepID=M1CRE3_SOLTU
MGVGSTHGFGQPSLGTLTTHMPRSIFQIGYLVRFWVYVIHIFRESITRLC